jgi:hypothetical protein
MAFEDGIALTRSRQEETNRPRTVMEAFGVRRQSGLIQTSHREFDGRRTIG